jgi:hypothetical protein
MLRHVRDDALLAVAETCRRLLRTPLALLSAHAARDAPNFQDVARTAQIHDVVTRAISGHATKSMQQHYSTAQRTEMHDALSKVVSVATSRRASGATSPPNRFHPALNP